MNSYRAGRRVEIQVADVMGERGYDTVLSSVSKGAADLVAFHDGETVLVQVKKSDKTAVTPAERIQLLRIAERVGGVAVVAYSGRDPLDARRTKIFYKQLTGPGPREWVWWVPRDSRAEAAGEAVVS